jgi:hypothetical protein
MRVVDSPIDVALSQGGLLEAVRQVNQTSVGANISQRTGRRIKMVKAEANLLAQGLMGPGCSIRIALVYDKNTNGGLPICNNLWLSLDDTWNAAKGCVKPLNLSNTDRFEVLYETWVELTGKVDNQGNNGTSTPPYYMNQASKHIKFEADLGGRITRYTSATSASIGSTISGGLLVFIHYTPFNGVSENSAAQLSGGVRTYYWT